MFISSKKYKLSLVELDIRTFPIYILAIVHLNVSTREISHPRLARYAFHKCKGAKSLADGRQSRAVAGVPVRGTVAWKTLGEYQRLADLATYLRPVSA